ncbi:hypothetical protein BDV95DRAFT_625833 [Massariosphaeria phaeospora]|uniref:Large ribosomal subunit protein mL59 domain-containing protein n=1 Tax=Massariosphaeria phaeospora TaxID=100035 RepID=A0A7C8IHR2_9PLEO|nr:hypothetical protein BDV95DRAFT_625833 [Massariosphaeria phaeospora]
MSSKQIALANSLPPRLIRFFEKFPPAAFLQPPSLPAIPATSPESIVASSPTATSTIANATIASTVPTDPPSSTPPAIADALPYPNPFLPRKNFVTGRWYGPVYGLRKQADLVKLAQKHDVVDLLPYTIKKPGEKEKRRVERGLAVKGTGVGQKVKGKKWERTLKGRLEERRKAMLNMPALIQEWKQKGHGRGWKKWPSGKAR